MKLVVAVIKPFKLDDVKKALLAMDVHGITVTDVRGFGRQRGHTEVYRGTEYQIDFVPKTRVEILTTDEHAEAVAAVVTETARTGKIGDGKVWSVELGQLMRVRTGELGDDAV